MNKSSILNLTLLMPSLYLIASCLIIYWSINTNVPVTPSGIVENSIVIFVFIASGYFAKYLTKSHKASQFITVTGGSLFYAAIFLALSYVSDNTLPNLGYYYEEIQLYTFGVIYLVITMFKCSLIFYESKTN